MLAPFQSCVEPILALPIPFPERVGVAGRFAVCPTCKSRQFLCRRKSESMEFYDPAKLTGTTNAPFFGFSDIFDREHSLIGSVELLACQCCPQLFCAS